MNYLVFLLFTLFLASCTYNAEVVKVDTVIAEQETVTIEEEPVIIYEEPPAEEQPVEEPQQETPTEEPAPEPTTYEATVIIKTGPSSYRVRTTEGQDLRILYRGQLTSGDTIRFTLDEGIAYNLEVIAAAPTY